MPFCLPCSLVQSSFASLAPLCRCFYSAPAIKASAAVSCYPARQLQRSWATGAGRKEVCLHFSLLPLQWPCRTRPRARLRARACSLLSRWLVRVRVCTLLSPPHPPHSCVRACTCLPSRPVPCLGLVPVRAHTHTSHFCSTSHTGDSWTLASVNQDVSLQC